MRKNLYVVGTERGCGTTLLTGGVARVLETQGHRVGVGKAFEVGCRLAEGVDQVDGMPGEMDARAQASLNRLAQLAGRPSMAVSARSPRTSLAPSQTERLQLWLSQAGDADAWNFDRFSPDVPVAGAADVAGRPVSWDALVGWLHGRAAATDITLLETSHGLFEPITDQHLALDLISAANFAVVVVAPTSVASVDRVLMALDVCQRHQIDVAGVVLNRISKRPRVEEAVVPALIEKHCGPIVSGVVPFFEPQDDAARYRSHIVSRLAVHLDIDALLRDRD